MCIGRGALLRPAESGGQGLGRSKVQEKGKSAVARGLKEAQSKAAGGERLRIVVKRNGNGSDFLRQQAAVTPQDELREYPRQRAFAFTQPLLRDEGRARPNFDSRHRDARH